MRKRTLVAKGVLAVVGLLTLAAAVVALIVVVSIGDTVLHGDENTQRKVAADTLSCAPGDIEISGIREVGCGRACLLATTGSSASWWSSYTCVLEIPATERKPH